MTDRLGILIVEDEPLVAMGISCCLEELHHEVLGTATTGLEALQMAESCEPDLILMDINIPELDGIIVMERLREKKNIPCIFLTGYSDSALIERAAGVNAYGYLIKPVDVHDLEAAIGIAMRRFREMDDSRRALADRKLVERAKGLLMDVLGMKEKQAMQFLQKRSRELNRKLPDLAKEIIEKGIRLHE